MGTRNKVIIGMIEHGIRTTEAYAWVHFFPLEANAYAYRVADAIAFVNRIHLPERVGRSKDGACTGAGYVIPRHLDFIVCSEVPNEYIESVNWRCMSDREFGLMGERIGLELIEHGVIRVPQRIVTLQSEESQFKAVDAEAGGAYEIKTERRKSANLFIQTRERGHRVHLVQTDKGVIEKITSAPWDE